MKIHTCVNFLSNIAAEMTDQNESSNNLGCTIQNKFKLLLPQGSSNINFERDFKYHAHSVNPLLSIII